MRIMRPRARLRVILHAEHRIALVLQPRERVVVQIHMRLHNVVWQARRIHIEVMILRRTLNLARLEILDRMIPAVVSELQLVRLPAQRQPEQLMPQADPEHRFLTLQFPDI